MTYPCGNYDTSEGVHGTIEGCLRFTWRGLNNISEGVYGMIEGLMTYQDGFMILQNGYMGQMEDV